MRPCDEFARPVHHTNSDLFMAFLFLEPFPGNYSHAVCACVLKLLAQQAVLNAHASHEHDPLFQGVACSLAVLAWLVFRANCDRVSFCNWPPECS